MQSLNGYTEVWKTRLSIASLTDTGCVRTINEDSIYCEEGDGISVFCVADGMGGYENGEKASGIIVETVKSWVRDFYPEKYENNFLAVSDDFEECLQKANQIIFQCYNRSRICGSTLVAMLIFQEKYAVFWLGDSRLYRKRSFRFEQLTRDDTWQNSPMLRREFSEEEIKHDKRYGKIVQAIGIQERVVPHRLTDKLKNGDYFLLCSDGVYRTCDNQLLKEICRDRIINRYPFSEKIKQVKIRAYEQGAPDNFSLILVRIDEIRWI